MISIVSDYLVRFHKPCDLNDEFVFTSDSTYIENDGCSADTFHYKWSLISDGLVYSEGTLNKYDFEEISNLRFTISRITEISGIQYKTVKTFEKY